MGKGRPNRHKFRKLTESPPESKKRVSQILDAISVDERRDRVSVSDLMQAMDARAVAALILLFALPNVVPTPPGTSSILGLPLLYLTAQMMLGKLPWLPARCVNMHLTGPVRVAVHGPNGCGKSTLLKVLAGEWRLVSGECSVQVPSAYIDQHLALLDDQRSLVEQLNLLDTPLAEAELRTRLAELDDSVSVSERVRAIVEGAYRKTAHKRALPIAPV